MTILERARALSWRTLMRRRSSRRPRRAAPTLCTLEGRELQTVLAGLYKITVVPQVLPPTSNGRFVPVTFFGQVKGTRPAATGYFHVTDEYRRVEPSGDVTLTPAGKSLGFYVFDFRFTVDLQAKRSTNTPDGRHYDVLVGAADADNSDGKTVTVLVPKVYPPPKPHARVAKSAF